MKNGELPIFWLLLVLHGMQIIKEQLLRFLQLILIAHQLSILSDTMDMIPTWTHFLSMLKFITMLQQLLLHLRIMEFVFKLFSYLLIYGLMELELFLVLRMSKYMLIIIVVNKLLVNIYVVSIIMTIMMLLTLHFSIMIRHKLI